MDATLEEALAGLDDPDTISEVMEAAGIDTSSIASDSVTQTPQNTLDQLYTTYLGHREDRSPATIAQYKRTIPKFISFSADHDVTTIDGVSADLINNYFNYLKTTKNADATIFTHTKNVRAWLAWISRQGKCSEDLYQVLDQEDLGLSPKARDTAIPTLVAKHVINKLRRERFGSRIHALTELTWNAGPRIGGLHSLDIQDFKPNHNKIELHHREEKGTRLKNGTAEDDSPGDGERHVTIKDSVVNAVNEYINHERPDVTDEYGREPLFTTPQGRASKSTLRRWIYKATSCRWMPQNENLPSDIEIPVCDGKCDPDSNVCPCSYYPHAIRRGAIVHHLSGDLRRDRASERFDVSIKVLKQHYDPRTKEEERQDRKEAVQNAWSDK